MTRCAALLLLLLLLSGSAAGPAPTIELPTHRPLRFFVVGDAGGPHTPLLPGMLAVEGKMHLDGILLVGDNFYPCGINGLSDPQWSKIRKQFGPTDLPIYPVLGNHDYGDQQEAGTTDYATCGHPDAGAEVAATGVVPGWHFPARHYRMHSSLADFVMFDSQPIALGFTSPVSGSDTAPEERAWVSSALEEMRGRWRIVVAHHTIYSSGVHGRANDATQQRMRALLPLLQEAHVDLYVCGHDHDLELIGHSKSTPGPLFLISGAGYEVRHLRKRSAADEPPTIYPPMPTTSYVGFATLEIEPDQLSIAFYDQTGRQTAGPFLITKSRRKD